MRKFLIFASTLGLSACDADGNLGRPESPVWHQRTTTEAKVAYFTPRCEAYGFSTGSAEMARCLQQEIQASESNARARMQAAADDMNSRQRQRLRTTCLTEGNITQCY